MCLYVKGNGSVRKSKEFKARKPAFTETRMYSNSRMLNRSAVYREIDMAFNHGALSAVSDRSCRISRLSVLEIHPSPSRMPAEKSRSIAQPVKRAKFSCDSASANAAGRPGARWAFTLSHDLKEIHPLWIMPRFPVRWRASRIQYLRPLSSYSLLGARAAHGNGRIVIVIEARGLSPSSSSSSTSPVHLLFRTPWCRTGCGAYNISDPHSALTYIRIHVYRVMMHVLALRLCGRDWAQSRSFLQLAVLIHRVFILHFFPVSCTAYRTWIARSTSKLRACSRIDKSHNSDADQAN